MISLILSLFLSACASADFPKNGEFVPPPSDPQMSASQKAGFDSAIAMVQKSFAPDVAAHGMKLLIRGDWNDGTVNAYASRQGSYALVDMFGGFYRYGTMTKAAFAGVICHEVGHHIGGRPSYSDGMACEGQADYWGSYNCLRRFYSKAQALEAWLVLAKNLARLSGDRSPSYRTPDPKRVTRTYCEHPEAQCRADTGHNANNGKSRPKCWYAGAFAQIEGADQ